MRFYIATSSPGKLRDFAAAAAPYGGAFTIEPLPGLAAIPAPAEDEVTFEGNARNKAIYYSRHGSGELVIADDSGLEVACLNGAPGVRSARYAEDQEFPHAAAATLDERNNAALLRALDGVPENRRQASYRCALALARDGEVLQVAAGRLDGSILLAPRGKGGFGYDPLFLLAEFGVTMAEADVTTRLRVSHRVHALRNLLEQLGPVNSPLNRG
jgi:XTP/dITP diphosphohydrolase